MDVVVIEWELLFFVIVVVIFNFCYVGNVIL